MDIAVWGHPASEFPEGKDSVADIRTWLGKLREAGIGKYIPFVTSGGQAIFESVALGPPQRDLLGPIIEVAGETGMEVHPIVGLGGVTPGFSEDEGYYVPLERPGKELPDWSRKWTDPAWYENVELICQVSEELLDNYACGGLHMDAVRYPNSSVLNEHPCVCARCRAVRDQWFGKEVPDEEDLASPGVAYVEAKMRGGLVGEVAWELYEICAERELPLSLAARARYLKDAVLEGQDWAEWCHSGMLDFVCPMSYNPCFDRFQRFVEEHTRLLEGAPVRLYPGVGRKSSLGTLSPQDMMQQLEYLRDRGIDAACIFHARALEDEDLRLLAAFNAADD